MPSVTLCRFSRVSALLLVLLSQFPPPAEAGDVTGDPSTRIQALFGEITSYWRRHLSVAGKPLKLAQLSVFNQVVDTACGRGKAQLGPFYCPMDETIYISRSFSQQLSETFKSPGDAALAYVIAHEFGHHIQKLIGVTERRQQAQALGSNTDAASLDVRVELQADCLAGMALKAGVGGRAVDAKEIDDAVATAEAVGDDAMQHDDAWNMAPDRFSHGSALQRARWIREGIDASSLEDCETVDWTKIAPKAKRIFDGDDRD